MLSGVVEPMTNLTVAIIGPVVDFLESLSYLGVNSHIVKSEFLDEKVAGLADGLGLDITLMKYTLALFAVYPVSSMLYNLPGATMKHAFSFLVGFALVQWIFGPDWIHTFITALGTYLIAAIVPGKMMPKIAFFFVLGYMTGAHIYRMYVSYMSGVFDFTGTQMVLTMKLTSFAYNLYDGTTDKENVFKTHEDKRKAKVYAERAKYAITSLPNPLEFFGYVYCFTCILAGPAFEYKDYARSIDGSAFKLKSGEVRKPATMLAGLQRLLVGVLCMVGYLQLGAHFKVKDHYSPDFIANTPLYIRYAMLMVTMFNDRLKFYFAWKVAEGASILGGFGFEGYSEDGKVIGWKGVENIDVIGYETAPNMQSIAKNWNKRTQGWLERYTYHRSGKSLIMTYFISALWHGLYPGFFIMFMSMALMTNVERLFKSRLNPIIIPEFDGYNLKTYPKGIVGQLYWAVCLVMTFAFMNYMAQVFSMGSLENCLTALGGSYYMPHSILVVAYIVLEVMPTGGAKKKKA